MIRWSISVATGCTLLFLCATAGAQTAGYTIQGLGSLDGGDSLAYGMNESGMVVGQSYNSVSGQAEAVIWNNGQIQSLGFEGLARSVNNSGTVVGETGGASLYAPNGRAFSWSSGTYTDLGDLGGAHAGAYDINENGTITGFAFTNLNDGGPDVYYSNAFKYQNGTMTNLGTVSTPYGYSRGHGINDAGEIAGRASLVKFAGSQKHMTTWSASGQISSNPTGTAYSTAQQINNNGLIVGNGYDENYNFRAMVWEGASFTIIDSFGGGDSRAWSVNDSDIIVGRSNDASNTLFATVSFDGATFVDLNSLVDNLVGWSVLNEAYDINELGQIVGYGTRTTGEKQAFLLTPVAVPVPPALWLFGTAIAALGWMRRRR